MDIGTVGESRVMNFANEYGIEATEPRNDKNGWDLYLEFESNLNILMRDNNFKAFVQVKSFDTDFEKYNGRNIKLSNIKKMIESNEPWFLFFVDIKEKIFHIVHFDETLIKKGYENIKKANLNKKKLNKVNLKINPHSDVRLVSLKDSDDLKKTLLNFIGYSMNTYSEKKEKIRKEIGYESSEIKFLTKFKIKDILNLELGYSDSLIITNEIENLQIETHGKSITLEDSLLIKKITSINEYENIETTFDFGDMKINLNLNFTKSSTFDAMRLFSDNIDIVQCGSSTSLSYKPAKEKI